MYEAWSPRTNILHLVISNIALTLDNRNETYCCATPVLRLLLSHNSPRLPTAPAAAACHLLSPSFPSLSGGPKVVLFHSPARILLLKYDKGGASLRRCNVKVYNNVKVPIMPPKRNGSGPKIVRRNRGRESLGACLRSKRNKRRRTLIPERTEKAKMNDPVASSIIYGGRQAIKETDAIPFSRQVLLHAHCLAEASIVHPHLSRLDLGLPVKPRRGIWCAHSDWQRAEEENPRKLGRVFF